MMKSVGMKWSHMLQFILMMCIVGVGIFLVYYNYTVTEVNASESKTEMKDVVVEVKDEKEYCLRWVWNELEDTVTPENNYYGGAKRWNLSEDLSMHMCWCYGMRITHFNPDIRYDGESFQGHFIWSKEDSNDIVFTDKKNYISVFDYERRMTSTFSKEGSRSYRFHEWSAYFFSDGTFQVTDNVGTITVMREGMFQIDPIADWRFELTPEYIMHIDQQFMISLLANQPPWEN